MINEIFPHRFNNSFIANKAINENDFILHFKENQILFKDTGDKIEIPKKRNFKSNLDSLKLVFLFTLDDTSCFLILDDIIEKDENLIYHEINVFRNIKDAKISWVSIASYHLWNWYENNKYCGKCGAKTLHKENERALICTDCHNTIYPKISPAIIVAIINENKILLARNRHFKGGWYSLIAGYADIGESLEETVIREVKEEVGLDVKNIRYYKSHPWPLSGSLMAGFIAKADLNQPIEIDENEIEEAAWFTRGNLPKHSSNISIAGEMIEKFEKGEL